MAEKRTDRALDRTELIKQTTLELAQELGFTKLSIEAVAARAGVGKHTIYRRWPSKGALFLDALLPADAQALDIPNTGDIEADLRTQTYAAVDLLGRPPFGPLYQALLGEAQHDPSVAAALNERFIGPQAQRVRARLKLAQRQGQVAPELDLDLAFAILSGPLYFQFLIAQEIVTHGYIDRVFSALFAGMRPSP
ncbi:TetR/AcrR family transcriptional regulator [Phytohabitans rumicis]|uniref:TetR family transcriptional regulator n=1 Tax=Phytohabitans rumicis TaxID=1076125 RepID=A0A6V8L0F2_9ACTN|nr:TetR/AcrR family transcriptional regulator [Phytohabitans rumicis]GFJ87577.1 TetR family transcriptional regulator [Phytohabitans rumicis]